MVDTEDGHPDQARWMSYGELARIQGISKASAARLAVRRCWTRKAGDDGSVWVGGPAIGAGVEAAPSGHNQASSSTVRMVLGCFAGESLETHNRLDRRLVRQGTQRHAPPLRG